MPDTTLARVLDAANVRIPFGRWQLVELTDLWVVPPFIKHDLQDTQTIRWTRRIPLLQTKSSAELAADLLNAHLDELLSHDDEDGSSWTIIDFNSGNGGPIPLIEPRINNGTRHQPIPFQLSDPDPHLNMDAWISHSSASHNLTFIPQPLNPANPSFAAISSTTPGDKKVVEEAGFESNGKKVIRTFCAAFHHFNDEHAMKVLKSSMLTSDGFVIVELRERTMFSLLMVLLEAGLFLLMAVFLFWRDPIHLLFTYGTPLLPLAQALDGVVSCLRMRTFEEVLKLVARVHGADSKAIEMEHDSRGARIRGWEFKHTRVLHTWPLGYMDVITGASISQEKGFE